MKKIYAFIIGLLMIAPASAGTIRYLQDVEFDKKASFGVSGTSDAILNFRNDTTTFTLTLESGVTSENFTLILPTSPAGAGQFIAVDGSGQIFFKDQTTASTFTLTEIQDFTLGSIETSSHTEIEVNYTESGTLNISVSSKVVLNAQINSIEALEAITSTDIITVGENAVLSDVTVNSMTVNSDLKLQRDKRIIFNSDDTGDTFITQESATDDLRFFKNGIEFMRFEN